MKSALASVVAASLAASSLAAPSFGQSQLTFAADKIADIKASFGELSNIKLDPGNVVEKGASWLQSHINDPRCELDSVGDA